MPCARRFSRAAIDLFDAHAFVHGVENALRPGFRAHPHLGASGAPQGRHGIARHQIAAGLHLERNLRVQSSPRHRRIRMVHRGESAKISSANQMWSGWNVVFR